MNELISFLYFCIHVISQPDYVTLVSFKQSNIGIVYEDKMPEKHG